MRVVIGTFIGLLAMQGAAAAQADCADLWYEREILSVANLTRADGDAFFPLAEAAQVRTQTVAYPLARANAALDDLRHGRLQGAAVLTI